MKRINSTFLLIIIIGPCLLQAQVSNVQWAKQGGGISTDVGWGIASDDFGNVLVTGYINATSQFGDTTLSNPDPNDMFLAKYDPNGNFLWARMDGGIGTDNALDIAVDAWGNSVITGYFRSNSVIGSDTLTWSGMGTQNNMLVVKYDPDGNVLWARQSGHDAEGREIAMDGQGNSIVAGNFDGSMISFGDTTLTSSGASGDNFIVKYDPNGNVLWARNSCHSADFSFVGGVTVDASENIIVTGEFRNTGYFGSDMLTSLDTHGDGYISKYDSDGNFLWVTQLSGSDLDNTQGIGTDAQGNIYVAGDFKNSLMMGSDTLLSVDPNLDMFIAKFDANGNFIWAEEINGPNNDHIQSLATDAYGNSTITGYLFETTTFGDTTVDSSLEDFNAFAAQYDTNGNLLWVKKFGSPNKEIGRDVAIDLFGNSVVTGEFSDIVPFEMDTLTSAGSTDVFITKIGSANPCNLHLTASTSSSQDTVMVQIHAQDACTLAFTGLDIAFDTTKLSFVEAFAGDLLGAGGLVTYGLNQPDEVGIGVGVPGGISGSGELLTAVFLKTDPVQALQTCFSFLNVQAKDTADNNLLLSLPPDTTCIDLPPPFVVWPGDTDNSGGVTIVDVLPLGIHWGKTDLPRPNRSNQWMAQPTYVWQDSVATYADSNGSGKVNQSDLYAIILNFGNTTPSNGPSNNSAREAEQGEGLTLPLLQAGETYQIRGRAIDAFQSGGLAVACQLDNIPSDAYELKIIFEEWQNQWASSDRLVIEHLNSAAVIQKGVGDLLHLEGALFTVEITAKQDWQQQPQLTLVDVSSVDEQHIVRSITNRIELSDPFPKTVLGIEETSQNRIYPNPFTSNTTISYHLQNKSKVVLAIYSLSSGRLIKTLVDESQQAGTYEVQWDGTNNANHLMASGLYFYRLTTETYSDSRKILFLGNE